MASKDIHQDLEPQTRQTATYPTFFSFPEEYLLGLVGSMPSTTHAMTNLSFNRAFVLKKEHLEKLASAFTNQIGVSTFDVRCSDQIDRTFSDVESVTSYENPQSRRILALTIRSLSEDATNSATLSIDGAGLNTFAFLAIGGEDKVRSLKESVEDQVSGMAPWYAWITRVNFVVLGFCTYVVAYTALLLTTVFSNSAATSSRPATTNSKAESIAILAIAGVLGSLVGLGWLCNRLRSRFFPLATFALGQGLDRYELQEKIRWGFIVAIAASFVASVIYGLLTN